MAKGRRKPSAAKLAEKAERTERLVAALKSKADTFRTSDQAFLQFVRQSAKFHRYSPNNQFLILFQRSDATAVNSYKRWQALGRQVRKDEKGIWILAPCPYKGTDAQGNEEERVFFKYVAVFDVSQTDPIEGAAEVWEPFRFPTLTEEIGEEYVDGLIASLRDEGHEVELFDTSTTYRGRFHVPSIPGAQVRIELWSEMPALQRLNTLVHELAHMEHWRIEPETLGLFNGRLAEFVAEAASYAVLSELGFDSSLKSVSYVALQGMAQGDTEESVMRLITKVVDSIMNRIESMPQVGVTPEAVAA